MVPGWLSPLSSVFLVRKMVKILKRSRWSWARGEMLRVPKLSRLFLATFSALKGLCPLYFYYI